MGYSGRLCFLMHRPFGFMRMAGPLFQQLPDSAHHYSESRAENIFRPRIIWRLLPKASTCS